MMAGLAVDSATATTGCAGCMKAEAEIQALLVQISTSFLKNPSKFVGLDLRQSEPVDCSELSQRWLENFDSDPKMPLCPELKKRIEQLVCKLLNERASACSVDRKRKAPAAADFDERLDEMLSSLKLVALDPGAGGDRDWKRKVLYARRALFLKVDNVADPQQYPYQRRHKRHKFLSSADGAADGVSSLLRRSRRTVLKIGNSDMPRKVIPVGPHFQADVPEWTGPPSKEDASELNNSKWLGTQIWPMEADDRQASKDTIGKGRASPCYCTSKGSVECIGFHVKEARLHLKSVLGPSFFALGFADMGEEISESWTREEQTKFDDFVRQNPPSECKSFWEPALEYFTSKRRRDIVSYYFNVFLLRWMSSRTRMSTQPIDSSDDENMGW